MALKKALFNIKGMTRDLAASKFSPEYAYENKNLRILATNDNTSGALVNERGNAIANSISGIPIGQAVIGDDLVIFSASKSTPSYQEGATSVRVETYGIPKFYYSSEDAKDDINGVSMTLLGESTDYVYFYAPQHTITAITDNSGERYIFTGLDYPFYKKVKSTALGFMYSISSMYLPNVPMDNDLPLSGDMKTFARVLYSDGDTIERFYFNNLGGLSKQVLYTGPLNFSTEKPIECLSLYEGDNLKKVYWTDNYNQPRVINIAASQSVIDTWKTRDYPFDFVRKLQLNEEVTITRELTAGGSFAPGVVQYCLSYYNLYGQQSNVFYTSPLYYVSYNDRGASPEDTLGVNFLIKVASQTIDTSYDYLRIYCLQRTSLDTTLYARKVVDIKLSDITPAVGEYISYIDNGIAGETIDPTELYYIGGQPTIFGTMAQKDNTLFLGDIKSLKPEVTSDIKNALSSAAISENYGHVYIGEIPSDYYTYNTHLNNNSFEITSFKSGETYRVGVQLQDAYGTWSDAVWVGDYTVRSNYHPSQNNAGRYQTVKLSVTITAAMEEEILSAGFVRIRPVVVYPSIHERTILCQGVLCPTVYNAEDRLGNFPFAMSSWFFRPNAPYETKYNYGLGRYTSEGAVYTYDADKTPVMSNYEQKVGGVTWVNRGIVNKGKWAEFRHNVPIPGNAEENAEIQCVSHPPMPFLGNVTDYGGDKVYTEQTDPSDWVNQNKECFYVDQSILTFHSPDIEFDKDIRSIDSSNLKLRIVGYIPITSQISDIDIIASTPPLNYKKNSTDVYPDVARGFYEEVVGFRYESSGHYGWKSILSGAFWLDEFYGSSVDNDRKLDVGFIVYPWHRSGSLNNTRAVPSGETRSAMLSKKKLSILRHSANPVFLSTVWNAYSENSTTKTGISNVTIFDDTESNLVKVKSPSNSSIGDFNYGANIDKVITFHTSEKNRYLDSDLDVAASTEHTSSYYPIIAAMAKLEGTVAINAETNNFKTNAPHHQFINQYSPLKEFYDDNGTLSKKFYVSSDVDSSGVDPVSMKFKSSPHAVIAFNYTADGRQVIAPTHNNINIVGTDAGTIGGNCPTTYSKALFWDPKYDSANDKIQGVFQDSITLSGTSAPDTGYLWLAELYNDTVDSSTRFGGQTEEAFENNRWLPAGKEVKLTGSTQTITLSNGDTYFQRYDCLKTYPFTMEDQNSVVDILSFMCETRVNIDGRYDRNRGQNNNLYMSPINFNLLNTAYSQRNNFFNYKGINLDKLSLNTFPNTITWTKTKTFGEEVDTWTNITLASTLDLDGNLGKVRALRKFNDSLIAFQDNGISQILYNENVQIASTTGVPIEIANSGKVSGKRYISNHIGCSNKWSICSTPSGLYFLDTNEKDIYLFNGEFRNLSGTLGFHSWVEQNLSTNKEWNPVDFDGCVLYYDKAESDVFIITKNDCLAFSEPLGQFSSFYDYESTPYFANIGNRGLAAHLVAPLGDNYSLYLHHEGNYNQFFGNYKPFWTTVVVNPDLSKDKVFNGVEYVADGYTVGGDYTEGYTFSTLRVWNEYQDGTASLANTVDMPSNLKKKFRTWRALIPRNTTNKGGDATHDYTRDRMRNPWVYLKLSKDSTSNNKFILHNLAVDYFE